MATIVTRAGKGSALTHNEVDANFTNLNTDKAELSGAAFTGNVDFAAGIDVTGNATFADNQKAIFGTGSDLQIYHDGSSSIIEDAGNGNLLLKTSNGANVQTYNANGNVTASFGTDTHLYYNGTERLRTTSTGANIYGTLDVDSTIRHIGDTNTLIGFYSDVIYFTTAGSQRMYINSSGNVGIGTTSPAHKLDVNGTVGATSVDFGNWTITETGGSLYFATGGTNKMKLDASGNLDVVGDVNTNATIT